MPERRDDPAGSTGGECREPATDRTGSDELQEGRTDRRHYRRPVLRPPFRNRARSAIDVSAGPRRAEEEADGHAGYGGRQPAQTRDDPFRPARPRQAPQWLWRNPGALRPALPRAAVGTGEWTRPRLYA